MALQLDNWKIETIKHNAAEWKLKLLQKFNNFCSLIREWSIISLVLASFLKPRARCFICSLDLLFIYIIFHKAFIHHSYCNFLFEIFECKTGKIKNLPARCWVNETQSKVHHYSYRQERAQILWRGETRKPIWLPSGSLRTFYSKLLSQRFDETFFFSTAINFYRHSTWNLFWRGAKPEGTRAWISKRWNWLSSLSFDLVANTVAKTWATTETF